jgi:hypothetical protein
MKDESYKLTSRGNITYVTFRSFLLPSYSAPTSVLLEYAVHGYFADASRYVSLIPLPLFSLALQLFPFLFLRFKNTIKTPPRISLYPRFL